MSRPDRALSFELQLTHLGPYSCRVARNDEQKQSCGCTFSTGQVDRAAHESGPPGDWSFKKQKHQHEIINRARHSSPDHSRNTNTRLHTLTMPATTAETLSIVNRTVSVAPLVLLSAADHYGRSAKGTRKRVVGVLLGQNDGKSVRVSNSFAGMPHLYL